MSVLFQEVQLLCGDGGIGSPSVHHKNASTWEEGRRRPRRGSVLCKVSVCAVFAPQAANFAVHYTCSQQSALDRNKAALGNQGSCKLFFVPVSSIAPLSQHVCLFVCGNCFFILRTPVPSVLRKGLDAVVESLP
jgi:hypothetical protein